jgi:type IV secretion system protein VirB6
MAMALRAAASMVAGWKPWVGRARDGFGAGRRDDPATMVIASPSVALPRSMTTIAGRGGFDRTPGADSTTSNSVFSTRDIRSAGTIAATAPPGQPPRRAAGIGSRFRPATTRAVMK